MEIIVVETKGLSFAELEKYLRFASPARREVIRKKLSEEDKVLSLLAALLVRSELSKRLGVPAKRLAFERGALGKPYLKGGGTQFSVSHTKGAVCLAMSYGESDIGVDIELKRRRVSERLKARVLSDGERAEVSSDEDFIRVWVKKEAFLKRTGIGVATDLKGADTSILPDTSVYPFGEYFIGASGRLSASAEIRMLPAEELLRRLLPDKE